MLYVQHLHVQTLSALTPIGVLRNVMCQNLPNLPEKIKTGLFSFGTFFPLLGKKPSFLNHEGS